MILKIDGNRDEINKALHAAILAMFEPAIKDYQKDGDLENLCTTLGCKAPPPPSESTPTVADQLKALAASSRQKE
ncbi:hypothetical protein WDW86_18425 [Bdellovibrionota bacterium FG-2]